MAALAHAALVFGGKPDVVSHADAAAEVDVTVRADQVPLEGLLLREVEEPVDPLAGDLPFLPLLPLRHG